MAAGQKTWTLLPWCLKVRSWESMRETSSVAELRLSEIIQHTKKFSPFAVETELERIPYNGLFFGFETHTP